MCSLIDIAVPWDGRVRNEENEMQEISRPSYRASESLANERGGIAVFVGSLGIVGNDLQ